LLSKQIPMRGERLPLHDRGKVLVQMALMLAGGGESCADIEHLRLQSDLFGSVPSDTTVFRSFHEIGSSTRNDLSASLAEVREKVWDQAGLLKGEDPVVLDIDASLVEIHSENKEGAAPHFKGGYGFHPMLCFADATGEALAGVLRPGNAGANTVADHVTVLDDAIRQLPEEIRVGHRAGDAAELVGRSVIVRADSAGCTTGFLSACRSRNVGFFVTARSNAQLHQAISDADNIEGVWLEAVTKDGEVRDAAMVADLTELIDTSGLPKGTRLLIRKEPLHPGAQRSLFPSLDFRYWGFLTDADGDPVELDLIMRSHAHVESHIQRLKDSGALPLALHQARRQRGVDVRGDAERGPRPVVPARLPRRELAERTSEGAALGDLPRTGQAHPKRSPTSRARHRRLADDRGHPRRLQAHRADHLSTELDPLEVPLALVRRAPTHLGGPR
jgi:hypothetical protein